MIGFGLEAISASLVYSSTPSFNSDGYDRDLNHALSFAKARNRCESPFFFVSSISAYVSPWCSKIGSQPMCQEYIQHVSPAECMGRLHAETQRTSG